MQHQSSENSSSNEKMQVQTSVENPGNMTIRSNHNRTINTKSFRQVLLATAIVKVQVKSGEQVSLRALVDPGGDGCSITQDAAQTLHAPIYNQHVEVQPFGGGPSISVNNVTQLSLKSLYNKSFQVDAPAVVLKTLTDLVPSNYVNVEHWPHIEGLQLADPEFFKPNKIDLVLGADVYYCILLEGLRKGPIGAPMARFQFKTKYHAKSHKITQNHVTMGLNESIQRFF